ncbi:MAG TPA: hypothetical protein VIL85_09265 [Thermomicrobiales bacterium]|jgi:adenine-specific DNA methylase
MSYTYTSSTAELAVAATTKEIPRRRALEDDAFPFEVLSAIAELESWRKEINRPIYHLHKWWAQRLGSVFRGILIGAMEEDPARVLPNFYTAVRYPSTTVFDPFTGSGTTIGEALKLGMRGIGRDINHVAAFTVRTALAQRSQHTIIEAYQALEDDIAPCIQRYYCSPQDDGTQAEVLYYFWVKVIYCPACEQPVDLFSSYVFSKNAYPTRVPEAQILCPNCGGIQQARYDATCVACYDCGMMFNPQHGPANGQKATCAHCAHTFSIVQAVRRRPGPPEHRMYAKMVLLVNKTKAYQRITPWDQALYEEAVGALAQRPDAHPIVAIAPGNNTNQVLNYHYTYWHEMFNARQLLCLSMLAERIRMIDDRSVRDLFICLFSGTLEFNNMFASFKGEGTGAVRHMFSHHILKPERTPLEANLWGTPKSSGAFSTLFRSRLLRAMEYRDHPFELRPTQVKGKTVGEKVYDLSAPMGRAVVEDYQAFAVDPNVVYLACGDSAHTDLPDNSVDLVITDPPFFDNVHYSELADFFYVWQRHLLAGETALTASTRSDREVQSSDAVIFAQRLQGVFIECHRILRPDGLLVFTYHHSRTEGWQAVLEAISGAGFTLTAAQPIKAEMSGATPKAQAKQPIDLDIIMVCRPQTLPSLNDRFTYDHAITVARKQIQRFRAHGRALSRNDVRVIVTAQLLRASLQEGTILGDAAAAMSQWEAQATGFINRTYEESQVAK